MNQVLKDILNSEEAAPGQRRLGFLCLSPGWPSGEREKRSPSSCLVTASSYAAGTRPGNLRDFPQTPK